ncbi:hypothetical protein ACFL27_22335 [candidate division CSSED10-310 bacterium]|uniref:Hydroxymethylglutaryl-CoA reductase-like domain-containing protein n=1 Tax=candidate division CSSED10-310 bacterium TaxID=2855610 RepID=A0ABV6Z3D3_UNCC1
MAEEYHTSKVFMAHLFRKGSLRVQKGRTSFVLENSTGEDILINKIESLAFDGRFIPLEDFLFLNIKKEVWKPTAVNNQNPLLFPQNVPLQVVIRNVELSSGMHNLRILFKAKTLGDIIVDVNDSLAT